MTQTKEKPHGDPLPLSAVPERTRVRLVSANCGRGLSFRLSSMGLRPGVEFIVVKSAGPGPLTVALGNSRLALGRGIAQKILVEPVNTP